MVVGTGEETAGVVVAGAGMLVDATATVDVCFTSTAGRAGRVCGLLETILTVAATGATEVEGAGVGFVVEEAAVAAAESASCFFLFSEA